MGTKQMKWKISFAVAAAPAAEFAEIAEIEEQELAIVDDKLNTEDDKEDDEDEEIKLLWAPLVESDLFFGNVSGLLK